MKIAIVFAAIFAVAFAAPQTQDPQAKILSQEAVISPDNKYYKYSSQSDNGISASEEGMLSEPKTPEASPAYVVKGEFSYLGTDGVTYTVRYTADESGFHPEGSHLPVAPLA